MDPLVKVNVGSGPNDGTGDPLRDAFIKLNKNVDAVVGALGAASGIATLGPDGRLLPGQAPAVQTLPATSHDLNNYQTPGSYRQASTAGAQAGINYPQATGGLLEVVGTGASGQALQRYTLASTGSVSPASGTRQYWRFSINTSWSPWQEVQTAGNSLPHLGRVEAGADLNNYANRGMWAIAASSTAAGGTNFPVANSGWLLVYAEAAAGAPAGTNVNQVYLASNLNRQYFRSLVGGTWSAWEEIVRSSLIGAVSGVGSLDSSGRQPVEQAPYSAILAAGVDANTLATPGVWHINSDANATAALNWPVQLAGTLNVEAVAAGNMQVTQTYTTRNGTGGVIRQFVRVRFGAAGTWGLWQEIAIFEAASGRLSSNRLPPVTESLWDGTTLSLGAGGRWVEGNFDGAHLATTASIRYRSGAGAAGTYLPIVPPAGGTYAGVICRTAADSNSAFAMLGITTTGPRAEIVFSRHGTGGIPLSLTFQSATTNCGAITYDGKWFLGGQYAQNIEARQYISHAGGNTQFGTIYRPAAQMDGTAILFQAYNGATAGYIQSNFNLSVTYATTSDYRSKEVLGEVDPDDALARVLRMRPVHFRMNGVAVVRRPLTGFVAHELQEVEHQAVTGYKDETRQNEAGETVPVMQGVDLSKIVPTLVAAIQKLEARLAAVEAAAGSPNL